MWRMTALAAFLAFAGSAAAQEPSRPQFDVVSIKRNVSNDAASSLRPEPNGLTGVNVTPLRLIRVAYQVADFQVVDAPGWFTSERYDVVARASGPVTMAQLAPMVRALLTDRFGLRIVPRARESTVLELRVDPNRRSGLTTSAQPCALSSPGVPVARGAAGMPACFSTAAGSMMARGVTTGMLAQELTRRLERFVVDRSALTGTFDFDLQWSPDAGATVSQDAALSDLPPLMTAVREQLGLRLDPARAPVDVYVVEAAARPGPD
jgi:uncharacterized protein (TIGR03435 family)